MRKDSFWKRIKFALAGIVGSWLVRLLNITQRYKEINSENYLRFHRQGRRVIYSFWHGRMLIPAYRFRKQNIQIMVSLHEDGEYIAQVVQRLGFGVIRGSTSRGSTAALLNMKKAADEGFDLAFTPDGPRGPRYVVQKGLIYTAQKTGLPIIPAGIEPSRYWQLRSWDEFRIPKPFGTTVVFLGDPVEVPENLTGEELEELRIKVERIMRELSREAEEECRRS